MACDGPSCDQPVYAIGLCQAHYTQRYRGHDLTPVGEAVKGHWPKGKLRKPPTGIDVAGLITESIRRHGRGGQRAVAKMLGVSPRCVGRWARGERYPSADEVAMILEALSIGTFSNRPYATRRKSRRTPPAAAE